MADNRTFLDKYMDRMRSEAAKPTEEDPTDPMVRLSREMLRGAENDLPTVPGAPKQEIPAATPATPQAPGAEAPPVQAPAAAAAAEEEKKEVANARVVEVLPDEKLEDVIAELHELTGLEDIKEHIDTLVNLLRVQAQRKAHDLPTVEIGLHRLFIGNPGTGKQLHKDVKVPLAFGGMSTVEKLSPGDMILGKNGKPTKIIGKYRPKENDLFEVKFSDGTLVKCGGSHLWEVQNKLQRAQRYKRAEHRRRKRVQSVSSEGIENLKNLDDNPKSLVELSKHSGTSYQWLYKLVKENGIKPDAILSVGSKRTRVRGFRPSSILKFEEKMRKFVKDQRGELYSILSTRDIIAGISQGKKFSVDVAQSSEYPTKDLPIEPYALGLWLGDGTSGTASIGGLYEDIEFYATQISHPLRISYNAPNEKYRSPMGEIVLGERDRSKGYPVNPILNYFRDLGLISPIGEKTDRYMKDIPEDYLYSNREQRLGLLAGLLDSDGHADPRQGGASFGNTNEKIVIKARQIVASLGMKPGPIKSKIPFAVSSDGKRVPGKRVYFFGFLPDEQVFRLPRKAKTLEEIRLNKLNTLKHQIKQKIRYIESIVPIQDNPEDYYCFEVDSPDHLFLITESYIPTHNTTVARFMGRLYKAAGRLSRGHLVETDRSGLVGGFVGQTALKTKEVLEAAKGGVLFLDEAYALVPDDGGNDFGQEAITTILKFMEDNREDFVFIGAGYPREMKRFIDSNSGFASRFNELMDFPDYDSAELGEIFDSMVKKNHYTLTKEGKEKVKADLQWFTENKNANFANGRLVRKYFEELIQNQANRLGRSKKELTKNQLKRIGISDFPKDLTKLL